MLNKTAQGRQLFVSSTCSLARTQHHPRSFLRCPRDLLCAGLAGTSSSCACVAQTWVQVLRCWLMFVPHGCLCSEVRRGKNWLRFLPYFFSDLFGCLLAHSFTTLSAAGTGVHSLLVDNLPSSRGWCYLPWNTLPEIFLLLVSTLTFCLPVTVSHYWSKEQWFQMPFLLFSLPFLFWPLESDKIFLLVSSNRSGYNFFLCFLTHFPISYKKTW